MVKGKRKEIRKEFAKAGKKRRKVRNALNKASRWNEDLTEKQRTKMSYAKAREQVVNKLYNQLKDLL